METQCQHLTTTQGNDLFKPLQKIEELFDGTLGTRKTDRVDFELKCDAKLICSQPCPVPKVREEIFKKKVEHLVLLGVLQVENIQNGDPNTLLNLNLNQIE